MREKLDNGLCIAVIGWLERNHDTFTRSLNSEQVMFMEQPPRQVPVKVGYVLCTPFAERSLMKRVRQVVPTLSHPLQTGQIRRILSDVIGDPIPSAVLVGPVPPKPEEKPPVATQRPEANASAPVTPEPSPATEEAPQSVPEENLETRIRRFAAGFVKETGGDRDKTLSKYQVSALLEQHFGPNKVSQGLHKRLLQGVVADGNSKAGSYRATEYLLQMAGVDPDIEPEDPIEKARWLTARGPILLTRRDALEKERDQILADLDRQKAETTARFSNEIGNINNELIRCQRAKDMLDNLKKL